MSRLRWVPIVAFTVAAACSGAEDREKRGSADTTSTGAGPSHSETTVAQTGAEVTLTDRDTARQLVQGVIVAIPYRLLRIIPETDTEECETRAIKVGTPVIVKDEGGKLVGVSRVEKGEARPDTPGASEAPRKCNLSWSVRVAQSRGYNFEVGDARATFTSEELAARNYSVRIEAPE